jgi:hypothetical protein
MNAYGYNYYNGSRGTTQTKRPNESAHFGDENLKMNVSLERGEGRYTKGFFNKTDMINLRLSVSIENTSGKRIKGVVATIKGKNGSVEKRLPATSYSNTSFDINAKQFGGNITASVVVTYKIGLTKTKVAKTTVSKNY